MTKKWICECSCSNKIYNKKCRCCNRPMPQSFIQIIYKEEIAYQLNFIRRENLGKSQKRINRIGLLMKRLNKAVIPVVGGIVIIMSASLVAFGNNNVKYSLQNYKNSKATRYNEELKDIKMSLSNVRSISASGGDYMRPVGQNFKDIWNGLGEVKQDLSEIINMEKIDNIINRFRGK